MRYAPFYKEALQRVSQVRANGENALTQSALQLSVLNIIRSALNMSWSMPWSLLPTMSKGERPTRQIDAHSSV